MITEDTKRDKMKQRKKSQSVFEYVILFAVMIVAISTIGFLPKVRNSFDNHFNLCVNNILTKPAKSDYSQTVFRTKNGNSSAVIDSDTNQEQTGEISGFTGLPEQERRGSNEDNS